jgi:hypothetical protein
MRKLGIKDEQRTNSASKSLSLISAPARSIPPST